MHAYPARVSIGYVTTYSIPCICFGSLEFGMHAATIVIMPDKHMYVYIVLYVRKRVQSAPLHSIFHACMGFHPVTKSG